MSSVLDYMISMSRVSFGMKSTYWYCQAQTNSYTGSHCYCGLTIVFTGEESWVLEGTVGAHKGELSTAQDGIGFEARILEKSGQVKAMRLALFLLRRHRFED